MMCFYIEISLCICILFNVSKLILIHEKTQLGYTRNKFILLFNVIGIVVKFLFTQTKQKYNYSQVCILILNANI